MKTRMLAATLAVLAGLATVACGGKGVVTLPGIPPALDCSSVHGFPVPGGIVAQVRYTVVLAQEGFAEPRFHDGLNEEGAGVYSYEVGPLPVGRHYGRMLVYLTAWEWGGPPTLWMEVEGQESNRCEVPLHR